MKKILIVLLLTLTACTSTPTPKDVVKKANSSESGFDTVIQFLSTETSQKKFDKQFEIVKDEFKHYNQYFDKYNDYEGINNIKTINDQAGIAPVKVDPMIIEMLEMAKSYTEITKGYFDVSFGAVLQVWHDYRDEGESLNAQGKPGRTPDMAILKEAEQYTGWQFVEINKEESTVYLNHKRAKLDVGAIAKGLATEWVALTLEEQGEAHAVISGGGNIRTIGNKGSGASWSIGVQEPKEIIFPSDLVAFQFPDSISIVTSGDYQRNYLAEDGIKHSHLINPKTLMPKSDFRSVTIFTPHSGEADILSTALYMMTYEEGTAFQKEYNEKYPERAFEVFWVSETETTWEESKGFHINMTEGLRSKAKAVD